MKSILWIKKVVSVTGVCHTPENKRNFNDGI